MNTFIARGLLFQSTYKQIFDIILLLLAFVIILWGAQFFTKKLARTQLGKQKSKNLQLIEAMYVSPGKMLQIIKVGERYFLIAVYKEGVTFLTEIQSEDLKEEEEILETAVNSPFAEYLNKLKKKAGHKDEK